MKDRFRFRAWDTKEDRYVSDDDICFDTGGSCDSVYDLLKQDDRFYIYEQCTGLKDKNGKLIYEGDIVRLDEWFGEATAYIKYEKNSSCYKLKNKHDSCLLSLFTSDEMGVIGNIHENPELLEGNNG